MKETFKKERDKQLKILTLQEQNLQLAINTGNKELENLAQAKLTGSITGRQCPPNRQRDLEEIRYAVRVSTCFTRPRSASFADRLRIRIARRKNRGGIGGQNIGVSFCDFYKQRDREDPRLRLSRSFSNFARTARNLI